MASIDWSTGDVKMAGLPSPTQVAGTHSAIYEAYLHQIDPNGTGAVQALDAARFLKKSRLSDVVLSKIWDLSDPTGKGYLDRSGLFVALKLVALAQAGKDINMSNIHSETPPPKVGELPKVPPMSAPPARPAAPAHAPHGDWTMKPSERDKYSQLFDSLQPNNGLIAGNKVKGVLMESKLPLETLGKIWDLADQDKDGMLDRHEFLVAMHLVYKALEKHAVPTTLPPELRAHTAPPRPPSRPPSRPHSRPASPQPRPPPPRPAPVTSHHQPQSNASLLEGLLDLSSPTQTAPSLMSSSSLMSSVPPSAPAAPWVVSATEKAHFDSMFAAADADRDGLVSGLEIKQTLLESGLPQQTLAHIWALCDSESVGKLTRDQFALAMWLVKRAQRGEAPPTTLAADMVPPSCRPAYSQPQPAQTMTMMQPEPVSLGPQPTPELEAIAREVDALARERLTLETELAARERDLALQTGEADSLQSELDTLSATLKQLENQKGEANKRLGDLKSQVDKLRSQVSAQEVAAAETEAEVAARRAAANTVKEKERALQEDVKQAEAEAETLNGHLRRTVLAVSQATIKIAHLEEQLSTLTQAAEALASTTSAAAHDQLNLQPQFSREHLERLVRGATPNDALEDDSFESRNEFGAMNGSGFGSDPFKDGAFPPSAAAVQPNDPFAPRSGQQDGFDADPFSKAFPTNSADPFASDAFSAPDSAAKSNDNAGWAEDPFAVLHAPTRDASPTPVLPPKKHKTPPPRPAPPRPAPALNKTERTAMEFTEDPFKDYRYEDPFNIEDPFSDVTDSRRHDPFNRPTSVGGFETDDFFANSNPAVNGNFPPKPSGRVSAPPVAYDPFNKPEYKPTLPTISTNNNDSWAAWPNDNWAADDAWAKPVNHKPVSNKSSSSDAWSSTNSKTTDAWKSDSWGNKSDNWATDWGTTNTDQNKNLNETWPSNTLPIKKEKSPKPVKYAKSLVHTIGGIGRTKHSKEKKDKSKGTNLEARSTDLPTEEQQWAWAAAESKRLEVEAEARRRQEDAELQLALAISRQEK